MQDHFLFDDDDPKQRGKGCDKLGTKKDGLALLWKWNIYSKKSGIHPTQGCYAELGNGWRLEVSFWHTDYEASVVHIGRDILSYHRTVSDTWKGKVLVTRLQAQLKAEQLVLDIWNELDDLIRKKKILVKKVVRVLTSGKKEKK